MYVYGCVRYSAFSTLCVRLPFDPTAADVVGISCTARILHRGRDAKAPRYLLTSSSLSSAFAANCSWMRPARDSSEVSTSISAGVRTTAQRSAAPRSSVILTATPAGGREGPLSFVCGGRPVHFPPGEAVSRSTDGRTRAVEGSGGVA
jgi:hypothetical protein